MQHTHKLLPAPVVISVLSGDSVRKFLVSIPMQGPFDWMRINNHCVITCGARSPMPAVALPIWRDQYDKAPIRVRLGGRDLPW